MHLTSGEQTVGIVGGGIVGLAVARELTRRRPGGRVVVFEKEDQVAFHQPGHNSGVVHAGIYYKPGSLKAELCTRGRELLRDYCAEHALPYDECGKLVVAVDPAELGRLDALEATAHQNDVPGLRRVEAAEIAENRAARSRSCRSALAGNGDHRLRRRGPVLRRLDRLVVCAGLQSDRVSRWADGQDGPRIVPFRGEYMSVRPEKADMVRGMVYPVPDPRYPFLGVHFTRRVSGALEVGPNAVLALRREGYRRRSDIAMADLRSMAGWPGFWRMARRHWRTGVTEVRGSLSLASYMRAAQRYVPEIGAADVVRGGSGIRAQAVDRDGGLVDDFRISQSEGITCVRNAPSPAATSSLAIAEHVVNQVEAHT